MASFHYAIDVADLHSQLACAAIDPGDSEIEELREEAERVLAEGQAGGAKRVKS